MCGVFVLAAGAGCNAMAQTFPAIRPAFLAEDGIPTRVPEMTRPPVDGISSETLETLENLTLAQNQPNELACRLDGICNIPTEMAVSAFPRIVGETEIFWATDLRANKNMEVQAVLRYITPHVYFWVQDGVAYDDAEMKALMDAFENGIHPVNHDFFGSEWSPGIDGDEHIYILYAGGLGSSTAGYFSPADTRHPLIYKFSNAHEMFLFNADEMPLGDQYTYGVLAHEFQHMIHWNQDLNETAWLNEGLSELAAFLNGYDPGRFDKLYISNTDLQLTDWPNDQESTTAHYGAGFLFTNYFFDRFGKDSIRMLVKDPADGLSSVENVLRAMNATDHTTGQRISADDFFMDWAVTNFLLDGSVGDGRYVYKNYAAATRASAFKTISNCPQPPLTFDVHQYGVDYIAMDCAGDYTLSFTGSTVTNLLPVDPYSGQYAFWSNKGDDADMTLTREFDFTHISGPIELSFRTWYDIETDWDYLYLEISEDGEAWQIITTPSGSATDPSGNSYGWGYTGSTPDWIEEKIDLSQYAGRKIFVRFEYVTDAGISREGLLLDDVKVDAAGYSSDFEADDGGWAAEGFVRIQNVLPQTFGLALIKTSDSSVTMIPLNEDQTANIPISLKPGEKVYLVVSGTTRFTRELGAYQIEIK